MADLVQPVQEPTQEQSLFKAMKAYSQPSKLDGYAAGMKAGFRNNLLNRGRDAFRSGIAKRAPLLDRIITAEEANETFETDMFTEDIRYVDAAIRYERDRQLSYQQAIMEEADLSTAESLLSQFAGGLFDPLAFGAGAGVGGLASLAGRSLVSAGIAVRFGRLLNMSANSTRPLSVFRQELVENAIASAALDIPLAEELENVYGEKVSNAEHVFNIATGTAAGSLLRIVGKSFVNGIDRGVQSKIFQEKVLGSFRTGEAPDPDGAIRRYKQDVHQYAIDGEAVAKAYREFGETQDSSHIAFSVHLLGMPGGGIPSQIVMGSHFGKKTLKLEFNPALAKAKTFDSPEVQINKFDTSGLKLLNMEESLAPESPQMKRFKQFLDKNFSEAEVEEILDGNNLKQMYKKMDEITTRSGKEELMDNANEVFSKQGFDGFIFDEDFFSESGLTPTGRSAVIFESSKKGEKSYMSSVRLDKNNQPEAVSSRMDLPDDEKPVKSGDQVASEAETSQNREQNYRDSGPIYNDQDWGKEYKETFGADKIVEESTPATLIAEATNLVDDAKEIVKQLEEFEPTKDTIALARELNAALEQLQPQIEEMGKMGKAAIACGKRNA